MTGSTKIPQYRVGVSRTLPAHDRPAAGRHRPEYRAAAGAWAWWRDAAPGADRTGPRLRADDPGRARAAIPGRAGGYSGTRHDRLRIPYRDVGALRRELVALRFG